MSKQEVLKNLSSFFVVSHIENWLSKFDNSYKFDKETYVGEFVDYINGL